MHDDNPYASPAGCEPTPLVIAEPVIRSPEDAETIILKLMRDVPRLAKGVKYLGFTLTLCVIGTCIAALFNHLVSLIVIASCSVAFAIIGEATARSIHLGRKQADFRFFHFMLCMILTFAGLVVIAELPNNLFLVKLTSLIVGIATFITLRICDSIIRGLSNLRLLEVPVESLSLQEIVDYVARIQATAEAINQTARVN